ncbi:zinc-dependent alcohol dehydrogenase family protein [Nocardioides sp. Iso805N]|uniref:zinc-dependent alcohol dehydrogenase family protein n=1 Tax=Nocardioides sp. Iso805N TaxID=1283287 RepID=UPI0003610619|nr:zinc-dependent alcohol dehydrogenase family protein [Nocardioides sp. Iso805N]
MARVVVFDQFGGPDVLHIIDEPVPQPAAGEVRVRVEAFAVNPLDAMMRAGSSPAPVSLPGARLGVEGTGTIDAVGSGVTGVQPGDPIIITAVPDAAVNGSYAEYLTVPASRVIPRPAGLDVRQAAAIWVAYSTAYGALVEKAGMRPGDRVLVNAASGGVGRAAIQVANQVGAVPIAVTRNATKEAELLSFGAASVIATDREDLLEAVLDFTGGSGADIVLDLVNGPGQRELVTAARPDAVMVAAGFLDLRPTTPPEAPLTFHRYRGFEHTLDSAVVRRMAAFMEAGVRLGSLVPTVGTVLSMDDVAEAHRQLEAGTGAGKTVVVI